MDLITSYLPSWSFYSANTMQISLQLNFNKNKSTRFVSRLDTFHKFISTPANISDFNILIEKMISNIYLFYNEHNIFYKELIKHDDIIHHWKENCDKATFDYFNNQLYEFSLLLNINDSTFDLIKMKEENEVDALNDWLIMEKELKPKILLELQIIEICNEKLNEIFENIEFRELNNYQVSSIIIYCLV